MSDKWMTIGRIALAYSVSMGILTVIGFLVGSFVAGEIWSPLDEVEKRGLLAWLSLGITFPVYHYLLPTKDASHD